MVESAIRPENILAELLGKAGETGLLNAALFQEKIETKTIKYKKNYYCKVESLPMTNIKKLNEWQATPITRDYW